MPEREPDQLSPHQTPRTGDPGIAMLGWLFLGGMVGRGVIHNVPQIWRTKAALKLEDLIRQGSDKFPFMRRLLPDVVDDLSDAQRFHPDPTLRASTTVERRLRGAYIEKDIGSVHRLLKREGVAYGGNVNDVMDPVFDAHFTGNIKTYIPDTETGLWGFHSMDWKHMSQMAHAGKDALSATLERNPNFESILRAGQNLRELSAIPAFRQRAEKFLLAKGVEQEAIDRFGFQKFFLADAQTYVKGIRPGDSVETMSRTMRAGGVELQTTRRFTGQNVLESISNFTIQPFGWKPFKLLFPTELIKSKPNVAFIGKEFASGMGAKEGDAAIFAGGRVFGVRDVRGVGGQITGRRISNEAIAENQRLFNVRTPEGRGFLASQDLLPYAGRETNFGELAKSGRPVVKALGFIGEKTGIGKAPAQSFFRKVMGGLRKLSDALGVGPQYRTSRQTRSYIGEAIARTKEISRNEARIVESMQTGQLPGGELITPAIAGSDLGMAVREGARGARGFVGRLLGKGGPGAYPSQFPKSVDDLSFFEKIQLTLGLEPRRAAIVESVSRSGNVTRNIRNLKVASFADKPIVDEVVDYYGDRRGQAAGTPGQLLKWALNQQAARPAWLLERGFGVGIKMGRSPLGTLGRWVGLAGTTYLGLEGLNYADYKIKQATGLSPKEAVLGGFLYGHAGQLALQEQMGLTAAAQQAENLYPGIESSPLSKAGRAAATLIGGAVLGRKLKHPALGVAGGIVGAVWQAGTDFTKKSREFTQEIQGERKVGVKRARWWGLGRQPYEGEGNQMYIPHWFQRMRSDYKEKAIYGSASQAWKGSWLPTPENLFLLKNVFDPYHAERRFYHSRPYPVSAPLFHEIPMIGPAMSATLGKVLKPTVHMHQDEIKYGMGGGGRTLGGQATNAMGFDYVPQTVPMEMGVRQDLDRLAADSLYAFKEFTGLPGFMYEAGFNALGLHVQREPMLADAGEIASSSRDYYDRSLGGLMGYTELVRRFITPPNKWGMLNPIANMTTPDWLPGRNSAFERDRSAVQDYHTGDLYTKIDMGEARLPGVGFEQLNELHSGKPGFYDPVDRFMVLADVAPTSAAFRTYKNIVDRWADKGLLDDKWLARYHEANEIAEQRTERLPSENERRFTRQNFHQASATIERVVGPGRFFAGGRMYQLSGVETDAQRLAFRDSLTDGQAEAASLKMQELQTQLESMVGQSVELSVGMREGSAFPVVIPGLNDKYINQGLGDGSNTALSAFAQYGQRTDAAMWESMRHFSMPGPANIVPSKFFSRYSALEQYQKREIEGADFAGWLDPVRNFLKPWAYQTYTAITDDISPSTEVQSRRMLDSYFDKLAYYKYRSLQKNAELLGDFHGADIMERMWRRTMVGMRAPDANWMRDAYSALPYREKKYFQQLKNIQDKGDRERVLKMAPPEVAHIYMGVWSSMDPGNDAINIPAGFQQLGAMGSGRPVNSIRDLDEQVARFMSTNAVPDDQWLGWNPSVDLDDMKLVTVETAGQDLHDYGMWSNQRDDIRYTQPHLFRQPAMQAFQGQTRYNASRYRTIMDHFNGNRVQPNYMGRNNMQIAYKRDYTQQIQGRYDGRGRFY